MKFLQLRTHEKSYTLFKQMGREFSETERKSVKKGMNKKLASKEMETLIESLKCLKGRNVLNRGRAPAGVAELVWAGLNSFWAHFLETTQKMLDLEQ